MAGPLLIASKLRKPDHKTEPVSSKRFGFCTLFGLFFRQSSTSRSCNKLLSVGLSEVTPGLHPYQWQSTVTHRVCAEPCVMATWQIFPLLYTSPPHPHPPSHGRKQQSLVHHPQLLLVYNHKWRKGSYTATLLCPVSAYSLLTKLSEW